MDYRELVRSTLVIDSHNDTIVAHIRRGGLSLSDDDARGNGDYSTISFLRGHEAPRPGAADVQIDFPKMREAGIDVGFFAVDVTLARGNHLAYALDGFSYFLNDLEQNAPDVVVVRRTGDLTRAKAEGKLAAVLVVEHAGCTERSLNVLRALYEVGVRSIGLTHNVSSWAADGCLEARDGVGLTAYRNHDVIGLSYVPDFVHPVVPSPTREELSRRFADTGAWLQHCRDEVEQRRREIAAREVAEARALAEREETMALSAEA